MNQLQATHPVAQLQAEIDQTKGEVAHLKAELSRLQSASQDEVSAAVAALFDQYAREYQTLSAQAAAFHQEFVQLLNAAGGAYAAAEDVHATRVTTHTP